MASLKFQSDSVNNKCSVMVLVDLNWNSEFTRALRFNWRKIINKRSKYQPYYHACDKGKPNYTIIGNPKFILKTSLEFFMPFDQCWNHHLVSDNQESCLPKTILGYHIYFVTVSLLSTSKNIVNVTILRSIVVGVFAAFGLFQYNQHILILNIINNDNK